MAIFSLIIGGYLVELVPFFNEYSQFSVLIFTGIVIFSGILLINLKGMVSSAMYGPEYKNPSKDTLKALFSCGTICLLIFVLVQTSTIATLGIEVVGEGNLPKMFKSTNNYGVPVNAMIFIIIFNCFLIMLKTPAAILAASSMGYSFANGISLISYYKYRKENNEIKNDGKFRAPVFWKYIALTFGLINLVLFVGGLVYLNSIDLGWKASIIGIVVLLSYIPVFILSNRDADKNKPEVFIEA